MRVNVLIDNLLVKNLVVFASGSGSNMEVLTRYFADSLLATVSAVVCNKPGAGVIERAGKLGIPVVMVNRQQLYVDSKLPEILHPLRPDLIILAGFLWLIPENVIKDYSGRIINIHPALLPSYGGKGMFGMNVHKAVIEAGEQYSGISIHQVNEHYDEGELLFQQALRLHPGETPESLAERIHELEHYYFPRVVEAFLNGKRLSPTPAK